MLLMIIGTLSDSFGVKSSIIAEGIASGSVSSSSEHWLQLHRHRLDILRRIKPDGSIDEFALRAGIANKINGADKTLTRFIPTQ